MSNKEMTKLVINDFKLSSKKEKTSFSPTGYAILNDMEGNPIYEGPNKIVVAGSAFTASKHINANPPVWTPSYNEVLGLENSEYVPTVDGVRKGEQIFLFCVGTGGCGKTPKEVKPVRYDSWIDSDNIVPFKYQPMSHDLNSVERQKYFGRKVMENNKRVAYYFKKFENKPEIRQQYLDGTPIDENVYTSARTDEIETFIELHLIVTQEDCKEYFDQTVGREEASLSSISILTAYETKVNGQVYYQNIRPLTKYNFPIESLIDSSKGLDITYFLYY